VKPLAERRRGKIKTSPRLLPTCASSSLITPRCNYAPPAGEEGAGEDSLALVAEAARGRKARTRMRRVAGLREERGERKEGDEGEREGEGGRGPWSCRRNEILTDFIVG